MKYPWTSFRRTSKKYSAATLQIATYTSLTFSMLHDASCFLLLFHTVYDTINAHSDMNIFFTGAIMMQHTYLMCMALVSTGSFHYCCSMQKGALKDVPRKQQEAVIKQFVQQAKNDEAQRAAKKAAGKSTAEVPTWREHFAVEAELYVRRLKAYEAKKGTVPAQLHPYTIVYIPHRQGFFTLRLLDCSPNCNPHLQQILTDFIDTKVKRESKPCKGVRADIYKEEDPEVVQEILATECREYITTMNNARKVVLFALDKVGVMGLDDDTLLEELERLAHDKKEIALRLLRTLYELPPFVSAEDIQKLLMMIEHGKLVKAQGKRELRICSFKGIIPDQEVLSSSKLIK